MCDTCHGEGLILKDNTRIFCSCPEGQRRKRNWHAYQDRIIAESRAGQQRRMRKTTKSGASRIRDYRAEAGGREPGED